MPSPLAPPWQVTGAEDSTSRWLRRRRLGGGRAKLLCQLLLGRRRLLLAAAPGHQGVLPLCPWVGRRLALPAPRRDQRRPLIDLIDLFCVCWSGPPLACCCVPACLLCTGACTDFIPVISTMAVWCLGGVPWPLAPRRDMGTLACPQPSTTGRLPRAVICIRRAWWRCQSGLGTVQR